MLALLPSWNQILVLRHASNAAPVSVHLRQDAISK
jgi:hypothetical protein